MEIKKKLFFDVQPFDPNGGGINRGNECSITVGEYSINIPKGTYAKIGKPRYVEVGFNDSKRIFGIKTLGDKPTKFAIEVSGRKSTFAISRTSVCKKIDGLKPFDRKVNNLILSSGELDEESGYWLWDLDEGKISARRTRSEE